MTCTFVTLWNRATDVCHRFPVAMTPCEAKQRLAERIGLGSQLDESPLSGYVRILNGVIMVFLFDDATEAAFAEENRLSLYESHETELERPVVS